MAQVAEQGEGFKRSRKGGIDVFSPAMDDCVIPAGTRKSRINGKNDMGILRGGIAVQGESANNKRHHGMSCAAPNQDHFLFATDKEVMDLELPRGKKMFPAYH